MCLLHNDVSTVLEQAKLKERAVDVIGSGRSELNILTSTRISSQRSEADPHTLGVRNKSCPLHSLLAPKTSGFLPGAFGDLLLCLTKLPKACLDFYQEWETLADTRVLFVPSSRYLG